MRLTNEPLTFNHCSVHIDAAKYMNGRTALELVAADHGGDAAGQTWERGERLYVATVNLPDHPLAPECIFVKAYSENEGMDDFLTRNGIIEPQPIGEVASGHVVIRSYRLTDDVLAKLAAAQQEALGGREVLYVVRATLRPGATPPSEAAIAGALEVGSDGAPEDLHLDSVRTFEVEPGNAALVALRAMFEVLNKDSDGDYFICAEAEQTLAHCRAVAGLEGIENFGKRDERVRTVWGRS